MNNAPRAALAAFLLLGACGRQTPPPAPTVMPDEAAQAVIDDPAASRAGDEELRLADDRRDRFSYANFNEVRVANLDLDAVVNFDERILDAVAILSVQRIDLLADTLVLDTNDLNIRSVEAEMDDAWIATPYILGPDDEVLGSRLEVALPEGVDRIRISYKTSPNAQGLQWLTPEQTAGKTHPFMYSQNQTINARSLAPVQDTPAVRMTYSAHLRTPPELLAVMSAAQDEGPRDGDYRFKMPQPIPAYLLAIAVGDLAFKPISNTIGVYAEPSVVDTAAEEFADTPQMEVATADLYGPYRWQRYDLLVLPPSFPLGGMENPRLSFLTPTLIAGDKSLTNVVAHELAHSWSGNLVTNATWRDAWLNEGVTSYVENRVMEALYGRDRAVMEQALTMADLQAEIAGAERPALTQLRLPVDLDSADDAFSDIAYAKGQFFLQFLEERFGRDVFDPFLRGYFDHFAFQTVVTADFERYLRDNLIPQRPEAVSGAEIAEWLYGQGLPASAPHPVSTAFEVIAAQQKTWLESGGDIALIKTSRWSAHEWLHFINILPNNLETDRMAKLDAAFNLTQSRNAEIAFAWYMKAVKTGYEPAMPAISAFLNRVGRGKFVYPLYRALRDAGRLAFAEEIFESARAGYHPIAQRRVRDVLQAQN